MNHQLEDLLYQSLETEQGGIVIYETAIRAALNKELRQEWEEYLEQTQNHEQILLTVFKTMGLDPKKTTPGRKIVHDIGAALVKAIEDAMHTASREAAEVVAAECVVLAETKDHHNWELLGEAAKTLTGANAKALKEAHKEVEEEEDEHLYHTAGWARELSLQLLGIPAVIPPPEEEKDVKTAIGAARAKKARKEML